MPFWALFASFCSLIRPTMNGHVVSPETNNQPVFLASRDADDANASKMWLFLRAFRLLGLSNLALLLVTSTSGTCLFGQSNHETPPISTEMKQFAPGVLVAVIGEEYVLAGDLLALIETQLQETKDRASETQYAEIRDKMMRQALAQVVQSKMLAQYFINEQVTGKPLHERIEAKRQMDKRVSEAFFEAVVPQMMKSEKVETPLELDRSLREEGTSLEAQKRVFRDSTFAQEALKKHVPKKFDIDALSMRDYYDSHLDEFRRPARARFRELAALYSQAGGVDEARRLIEQMGNEVFLGGAPFEAVAKKSSHGYKASEGGVYEWLTKGSLKNEQVDAAVFSIPVRRLSKIIEENDGLRIIEVLEREPERIVSFEEAQAEIKDILSKQRGKQSKDALVEKLKRNTSIWSLWPDDIPGAKPLSDLSLAKEPGKP